MKIHIIRHAESIANIQHILAGQQDFPLSKKGQEDARLLAARYLSHHNPSQIYCSPLVRARQTASPFLDSSNRILLIDRRLIEQDIGIFSGKTYEEAEADPRYEKNRTKRWQWTPPGGESYESMAKRISSFFSSIPTEGPSCLIVTHAITMRIIRGLLEHTLPIYPETIAQNGEIWEVSYRGLGVCHHIESLFFEDLDYTAHRD